MLYENDYVNYSTNGICKIEEIRSMKFGGSPFESKYYILRPLDQSNGTIFVPADNQKLVDCMRPILSPSEIDAIIASVKNQCPSWIEDRKQRKAVFQEILSKRDERELLLLVICLHAREAECEKGLSASDAATLKKAMAVIDQEFSFSLKISRQEIRSYLREKLGLSQQQAPCAAAVNL